MQNSSFSFIQRVCGWARHFLTKRLKLMVHFGALLPLAFLVGEALTGRLTANPIQAATLRTGKTALTLLMTTLACTPLASLMGFKELLKARRLLGLYTFLYVSLHFSIFLGLDYGFNLSLVLAELSEKRYILAGFTSGLMLVPLAVTSFRCWMKRLGKNWKRLHRLVYPAALLAVIHYLWLVKADIRLPLLYGAILIFLLCLRLPIIKQAILNLRYKSPQKSTLKSNS